MTYQRFKKGGWVAKNPFLAKSVKDRLIKNDFFFKKKSAFFESPITQKQSICEHGCA